MARYPDFCVKLTQKARNLIAELVETDLERDASNRIGEANLSLTEIINMS